MLAPDSTRTDGAGGAGARVASRPAPASRGTARAREQAIAQLAGRQRGVVHRAQLLLAGFTRAAIEHRLATGRLIRLHGSVYAVGHTALPPFGREFAALLAVGPDAVLSHRSAAAIWRLLEPWLHEPVDVTVVGRNPGRSKGIRIHRSLSLSPGDLRQRQGMRVTSPLRTLMDLAATASDHDLERAVAEAQVARLVTVDELAAGVRAASGRRGAGRLRRLLDDGDAAPTRSVAEREMRALVRRAGLPAPESNSVVAGHEVDLLWRAARLVVEVDGYAAHHTRKAFEKDRMRDAELLLAGHRVLRLTWRQLNTQPEAVVARLAAALALAPGVDG